jgi:molybdopterin adenylyltransferase
MSEGEFSPLGVGVLTVSDTRSEATDTSGGFIVQTLTHAGHVVRARRIVEDELLAIQEVFRSWQLELELDVVITTGGTGITARDVTEEALRPFISKSIPGFGELFRWLSFEEIGAATIQSRAFAALCENTLLFALPGSTGAVRLALERIVIPQLDARTKPCNFAMLMPKVRGQSPP